MSREFFKVILTIVFALVLAAVVFYGLAFLNPGGQQSIGILVIPFLIIIFGHPLILFVALLLSKLILRIKERGKFLYILGIPCQISATIILYSLASLPQLFFEYDISSVISTAIYLTTPVVNLIILLIIDAISPQKKKSNLPAYYDGE